MTGSTGTATGGFVQHPKFIPAIDISKLKLSGNEIAMKG